MAIKIISVITLKTPKNCSATDNCHKQIEFSAEDRFISCLFHGFRFQFSTPTCELQLLLFLVWSGAITCISRFPCICEKIAYSLKVQAHQGREDMMVAMWSGWSYCIYSWEACRDEYIIMLNLLFPLFPFVKSGTPAITTCTQDASSLLS